MKTYSNVDQLISAAKTIVAKYTYLYGAKGEIITEKLIQRLKSENPSMYTSSYVAKARRKIGRLGLDCSGLFYKLGVCGIIGSYQMREKWVNVPIADVKPGYAVYKRGHIALCTKVLDSNTIEIAEMRGIDYDNSVRQTKKSEWLCGLVVPNVDYEPTKHYLIGWNKDQNGWWYADTDSTYLKNCIAKLRWSGGEDYFYFNDKGYCVENATLTIDENGRILEV